ncbi:acetyltransferase [Candidatus Bipolaricaulota bacterium]|nr:acetyltransferase [Candidatus Bipolaricaulota bacterium]
MSNVAFQGVVVLGGSGHAKVVIATLRAQGCRDLVVLDDDPEKQGRAILGVQICGSLENVRAYPGWQAIIAIGDNTARAAVARRISGASWTCAVHPTAFVEISAQIGEGTVIFAGAVVQPDSAIGTHVIINTGATVDHDCSIDDFVHLAPGVNLGGLISIGEGAFLGVGARVIPGVHIGSWATVGAGAVVIRDVPDRATVVGVPARAIRSRT